MFNLKCATLFLRPDLQENDDVASDKKMGRPPFEDAQQVRSEKLSITLTARQKAAVQRGARSEDRTASTLTREAVLTHPAVVAHLDLQSDYVSLRLIARDWLSRTEQMVAYFDDYLEASERAEFTELIELLRQRVTLYEKLLPLDPE